MSGWAGLGAALGGGVDAARESGHLEGMKVGAQTQNALAQARLRQVEERVKMDELSNRNSLSNALVNMGVPGNQADGLATVMRGGFGNVQQGFNALQTQQTIGARGEALDPNTDFSRTQQIRAGLGDSAFNPTSVQGGLSFDLMADDPYGSAQVTPGEQASINQRNAAARLSDARVEWGPTSGANRGLGTDMTELMEGIEGLPTGIDPSINFSEGAGTAAWVARLGNIIAGVVPGVDMPAPDRERAINALEDLQGRTVMSARGLVDQRMSNQMMDMLERFTVKPADVLRGEGRALTRLDQTRQYLDGRVQELQFILSRPGGTPTQRRALERDLVTLANLSRAYSQVVDQFRTPSAQGTVQRPSLGEEMMLPPAQTDAPPPPGVDPEDWNWMTPEERALWQ